MFNKFFIFVFLLLSHKSFSQNTSLDVRTKAKAKFGIVIGLCDAKKSDEKNLSYQFGYRFGLFNSITFSQKVFLTAQLSLVYDKSKILTNKILGGNPQGSLDFEEINYWIELPFQLNILPFNSSKQFFVGAGVAPRMLLKSDADLAYTFINPNGLPETVTGNYSLLSRRNKFNLFFNAQVGYQIHKLLISISFERNLFSMVRVNSDSIVITYLDPDYTLNTTSIIISYLF